MKKQNNWFDIFMTIVAIAVFILILPLTYFLIKLVFTFFAGLNPWIQFTIIVAALIYLFKTM